MKTRSVFVLAIVLGLAMVAANVQAAEPAPQTWSKKFSSNQITGMIVKGQQGEELGRVQDLVIDPRGYVSFAVISHGGFLGLGEKLVAIPFSDLKFDRTGRYVVVDASKEKFDSAPAFKVSDLSNEKWAADDYRFFGQRPYWTEEEVPTQETSPSQGKSSKNSTEKEYPYTPLVPF